LRSRVCSPRVAQRRRQRDAEDFAEFLLREDLLLTALELHQESKEPGRRFAPLRMLEERFGSAAAVDELSREAAKEASIHDAESAGLASAAAGIAALSSVANPVSAAGLATALEAREQALAVSEYRLRGAQRDAKDAAAALDASHAEVAALRARLAAVPAGEGAAAGGGAAGRGEGNDDAAPRAPLSDAERSRLDGAVLSYLRSRGFSVAAVAVEEAMGPSALAAAADGGDGGPVAMEDVFAGAVRPARAVREAAGREQESARRAAELESRLEQATRELSREVAARRSAVADLEAARAAAEAVGAPVPAPAPQGRHRDVGAAAEPAATAAGGAKSGPKGSAPGDRHAEGAVASVSADPQALLAKLTQSLPRLSGMLGARQRAALLPLFAGAVAAHPEAPARRRLLSDMCTLVKRPRAAERAALVRELASVAAAAASGAQGVCVTEAEVVEAVVLLGTHRARERRAAAALACGAVSRHVEGRDSLLATLSMLWGAAAAGRGGGEAPVVRRAVLRGVATMMQSLAEVAGEADADGDEAARRVLVRQASSLTELMWSGLGAGPEEAAAAAAAARGAAGAASGGGGDGRGEDADEDEDDDDEGDGDLGQLLRSSGRAARLGDETGADAVGPRSNGLAGPPSIPLLAAGRVVPAAVTLAHRLGVLWGHGDAGAGAGDAAGEDDAEALLPDLVGRLGAAVEETRGRGALAGGRDREAAASEATAFLLAVAAAVPHLHLLVLRDGYAVGRLRGLGGGDAGGGGGDDDCPVDVVLVRCRTGDEEGAAADAPYELVSADAEAGDAAERTRGGEGHVRAIRQAAVMSAVLSGEAVLARRSGGEAWEAVPQRLAPGRREDGEEGDDDGAEGAGHGSAGGYFLTWPALRRFTRVVLCAGVLAAAGRASTSTSAGRRVNAAAAATLRCLADAFGSAYCARVVRPALHWALGIAARPAEDGPGDDGRPFDKPVGGETASSRPSADSDQAAWAAHVALAALGAEAPGFLPPTSVLAAQVMLGGVSGAPAPEVAEASFAWRGFWQVLPELSWAKSEPGAARGAGVRLAESLLPCLGTGLLGSPRLPRPLLTSTLRALLVLPVKGRDGWGQAQRPQVEAAVATACASSEKAASAVLSVLHRVGTNSDPLTRDAVAAAVGALLAASAVPESAMLASALPILVSLCADGDDRVRRSAVRGAASLFSSHGPGPLLAAAGDAAATAIARGPKSVVLEAMRGFARAVPRAAPATRDGPLLDRVIEVTTALLGAAASGHDAMIEACRQIGGEAAVAAVTGQPAPGGEDEGNEELTAAAAAAARTSRDAAVQGAAPWGGACWDDVEEVATACAEALRAFAPSAASMGADSFQVWRGVCSALVGDDGDGRRVGVLDEGYREMVMATMAGAIGAAPSGTAFGDDDAAAGFGDDTGGRSDDGGDGAAHGTAGGRGSASSSARAGAASGAAAADTADDHEADGGVSLASFLGGGEAGAAAAASGGGEGEEEEEEDGVAPFVPDDAPTERQGMFGRLRGRLQTAKTKILRR